MEKQVAIMINKYSTHQYIRINKNIQHTPSSLIRTKDKSTFVYEKNTVKPGGKLIPGTTTNVTGCCYSSEQD